VRTHRVAESLASARQVVAAWWYLRRATAKSRVRLQGKALCINHGTMLLGDRLRINGSTVRVELVCWENARVVIGDGTFINYGSNIAAMESVEIGRNCDIGQYAIIMDDDYHALDDHHRQPPPKAIVIEDDVWLGARVTVLPGAYIGKGAVIGAHAVVKGHIPAGTVAGGVPARVITTVEEAVARSPEHRGPVKKAARAPRH
jgi:maltose O-acetyltransferase